MCSVLLWCSYLNISKLFVKPLCQVWTILHGGYLVCLREHHTVALQFICFSEKDSTRTASTEVNSYLPFVEEAADRTDDAGRPCSKHLHDSSSVQSSEQLLQAHCTLCHFELVLTEAQEANNAAIGYDL